MKRTILTIVMVMIFLFPSLIFSQENCENSSKGMSGVLEFRQASKLKKDHEDYKSSEANIILRYMWSEKVGVVGIIKLNDTISVSSVGIALLPTSWLRFDVAAGFGTYNSAYLPRQDKSFALSIRTWMGNDLQNFWVNIYEGDLPFQIEAIYMIRPVDWFAIGGMVQSIGYGPRLELHIPTPGNPIIWAAVQSNWENTATGTGYDPQTYFTMGVKLVF